MSKRILVVEESRMNDFANDVVPIQNVIGRTEAWTN
jgi:hypothetical protein